MLGTLQQTKRKYNYHRSQYQKTEGNVKAKTKRRKPKTSLIRKQIFIRYRKELCDKRIRSTGSSVEIRTLSTVHIREATETINRPPSAGTTH